MPFISPLMPVPHHKLNATEQNWHGLILASVRCMFKEFIQIANRQCCLFGVVTLQRHVDSLQ